jgi:hypothetical protein
MDIDLSSFLSQPLVSHLSYSYSFKKYRKIDNSSEVLAINNTLFNAIHVNEDRETI